MEELTDDQLDGLFRKSAEEFEPEFDAAAWQAMQQQLNERDKTLFWGKLIRWSIPVITLLLLTGSGWYVYKNRPTNANSGANPVAKLTKSQSTTNRVIKPSVDGKRPGQTALDQDSSTPEDPLVQPTQRITKTDPITETASRTKSTRLYSKPENYPATDLAGRTSVRKYFAPSTNLSKQIFPSSADRQRTVTLPGDPAGGAPFSDLGQDPPKSVVNAGNIVGIAMSSVAECKFPVDIPNLTTLAGKPARWSSADTLSQHEVNRPAVEAPVKSSPIQQRGLSVRLVLSPDLSSVGLRDFQRPGTNIGALLEYQFATRWRVQTGVLRSVKVYESSATRYEWGSTTWLVQPESVYGRCNMLDIPLNLRYDFARRSRPDGRQNRWFASGGLTTYVMLLEDYSYKYANPDDPRINGRAREWTVSTGGYGFSHLNVSVGYERAFNKRLSWQIEPFLKVPLKGVGYYKLNLLSTGSFFSLRYKLR